MASSLLAIKILAMIFAAMVLPVVAVWVLIKAFQALFFVLAQLGKGVSATVRGIARGVGGSVRHVARFVRDEVVDSLRFAGGTLTAVAILPLAGLNLCLGRWASAVHFGRALEDEVASSAVSLYRVLVGNPVRLLGLGILTEGLERRLPDLVAHAPEPRAKAHKPGRFEGFKVTGTLPAGGSGAQLYVARPSSEKLAAWRAAGRPDPGQVVIKAFALSTGSTLPQIVRESRALEAASRLGLVLEHELADQSFHYVMPFVPGDTLDLVTARMHARCGEGGLSNRDLEIVTGYASDLLATLDRFHAGGLWHKDIKPSNLIVSSGRVNLVDLGLVTPLSSALTLTTHGTEYFRDPEMVRLALKGVKVHEVDGVRFDIYSAGAVLYSMIENSFPAHGSLSRITKRCPEVLRWIVHRAMADMNARYANASEMLADLRALMAAKDPFALKPAELPSVCGLVDWSVLGAARREDPVAAAPASFAPAEPERAPASAPSAKGLRRRASRGLLAAALWMLLLGGSVASIAALRMRAGSAPDAAAPVWIASPTVPAPEPWARLHARGQPAEAQQEVRAELVATFERELPERTAGERVLVLEDLGPTADRRILDALHAALRSSGCRSFGARGAEGGAAEIELEALARRSAGLSDPGDPDTLRRVREFLAERSELDVVLWLTRADEQGSVRMVWIEEGPDRAEAPRSLLPAAELARAR